MIRRCSDVEQKQSPGHPPVIDTLVRVLFIFSNDAVVRVRQMR